MQPPIDHDSYTECPLCNGCLCDYECSGVQCLCGYYSDLKDHTKDCNGCPECTPKNE